MVSITPSANDTVQIGHKLRDWIEAVLGVTSTGLNRSGCFEAGHGWAQTSCGDVGSMIPSRRVARVLPCLRFKSMFSCFNSWLSWGRNLLFGSYSPYYVYIYIHTHTLLCRLNFPRFARIFEVGIPRFARHWSPFWDSPVMSERQTTASTHGGDAGLARWTAWEDAILIYLGDVGFV